MSKQISYEELAEKVIAAVYAVPLVPERLCENEVAVRVAVGLEAVIEEILPEALEPDNEEWIGKSAWVQAEQSARFRFLCLIHALKGSTEGIVLPKACVVKGAELKKVKIKQHDFRELCVRVLKAESLILPRGEDYWKEHEAEAIALSRLMKDIHNALLETRQEEF